MKFSDIKLNKQFSQYRGLGRFNECFYCKCKSNIVSAHSISEARCLSLLSEDFNGQKGVYAFNNIHIEGKEWFIPKEEYYFCLTGISQASTFRGFCEKHDREIFKLIDTKSFDSNSMEQCFLYCYRAFAYGYHRKRENIKSSNKFSAYKEHNPFFIEQFGKNCQLAVDLDCKNLADSLPKWLREKKYGKLYHLYFKTKSSVPIASANVIQPTYDINGETFNNWENEGIPLSHIFINIIPELNCTHILISCLKQDKKSVEYLEKIKALLGIDNDWIGKYLTMLLVYFTDNTYIKPSYINRNNLVKQKILYRLVKTGSIDEADYFINNPQCDINLFEESL